MTDDFNNDLLDSLEISTGHIQREQVADAGALAKSVAALPDHLRGSATGTTGATGAFAPDPDAPTPCAFVTGRAGSGKCLGKGTSVMLADGRTVPVEAVCIGDLLMGPDSKPRRVLSVTSGYDDLYRITPVKGEPFVANGNHIMVIQLSGKYYNNREIEISVKDWLCSSSRMKKDSKAIRTGVDFPARLLSVVSPYFLGLWLGDGESLNTRISNPEPEIVEYLKTYAAGLQLCLKKVSTDGECPLWAITTGVKGRPNILRDELRRLGVFGNKHIPRCYLHNSREVRLHLLAGLLDTDGYLQGNCYQIISKWERFADDIVYLARSLGLAAYKTKKEKTCQVPGFVGTYWDVSISGDVDMIPCRVARRKAQPRRQVKNVLRTGIKIVPIGKGAYYGFMLDGDGRFLLGDFTVTHNSTLIRERCAEDPHYAILAASTGIAAINLNTVTIHSLLGFFDTDSLRDAYIKGTAQRKLRRVAEEGYRNVVVDECSMISHPQLDVLVRVFDDVNQQRAMEGKDVIGLILVGDLCQLPAIPDQPRQPFSAAAPRGRRRQSLPTPWLFESHFWPRFAANATHLTKVWRQADPRFLAALDFARSGRGRDCLQVLQSCGHRFESGVDMAFDGTTVVGKNDEVDRINQIRLDREKGRLIALPSRRWTAGAHAQPEWKNIPERTLLREGCYVMILANQYDGREMVYANGDCGWVRGIQPSAIKGVPPTVMVELVRTGEIVHVSPLVRDVSAGERPDWLQKDCPVQGEDEDGAYFAEPHHRRKKGRWVTGQLQYFPLRLAYATTVHKCQGLSMDRTQVDFRTWNYKTPGMLYVALSRCRTLAGLRLVGTPELLVDRCRIDEKVRRWL